MPTQLKLRTYKCFHLACKYTQQKSHIPSPAKITLNHKSMSQKCPLEQNIHKHILTQMLLNITHIQSKIRCMMCLSPCGKPKNTLKGLFTPSQHLHLPRSSHPYQMAFLLVHLQDISSSPTHLSVSLHCNSQWSLHSNYSNPYTPHWTPLRHLKRSGSGREGRDEEEQHGRLHRHSETQCRVERKKKKRKDFFIATSIVLQ